MVIPFHPSSKNPFIYGWKLVRNRLKAYLQEEEKQEEKPDTEGV
jgi:hypothetical protein